MTYLGSSTDFNKAVFIRYTAEVNNNCVQVGEKSAYVYLKTKNLLDDEFDLKTGNR
jgi:hypothetical protein